MCLEREESEDMMKEYYLVTRGIGEEAVRNFRKTSKQ